MLLVGVTGGIGSGKTTFAALLAERGATLIDADLLGREALDPGQPAWNSVVDQFGDEILARPTLNIDRKRLADIVFNDPGKLAALNAIVHPQIMAAIADRLEAARGTDDIVVLDAALITELGLEEMLDVMIAVTASRQLRRERLVTRGMELSDINSRMAAQADPKTVETKAAIVVTNEGSLESLTKRADEVWAELVERAKR